jgi:GNAT superfamily N-acetyltransferase
MEAGQQFPDGIEHNGYNISYEGPIYSSLYGDGQHSETLSVRASHPEHGDVGHLYWHPRTGTIKDVLVHGDHQGQGIATQMYNLAHRVAATTRGVPKPQHSQDRTDAGDSWAKKVGGRLPRRKKDIY